MDIGFWQQPNFTVPYGKLRVLRTDPGGLVAYSWRVSDARAEEAQEWIRPQMERCPEPPPAPEPEPVREELVEIPVRVIRDAVDAADLLRRLKARVN